MKSDETKGGAWLVAGLGNPGARYAPTYHNLGRMAAEAFAERKSGNVGRWVVKFKGQTCMVQVGEASVLVLLPLTYMNLSGESVVEVAKEHAVPLEKIIVVHDDLDLALGTVRLKVGGGDGGHKGLASCIAHLGSPQFVRVRIGIGRDPLQDPADYVLSRIKPEHEEVFREAVQRAVAAIEAVIVKGVSLAMNEFNRRPKPAEKTEGDDANRLP